MVSLRQNRLGKNVRVTMLIIGSIMAFFLATSADEPLGVNAALSAPRMDAGPGYVYPQTFGAIGDGVHDDTRALQEAIDKARAAQLTLMLPAGHYRITQFLDWGLW